MAAISGSTMEGPWIPTNQNNAKAPKMIVIPIQPLAAVNNGSNTLSTASATFVLIVALIVKSIPYKIKITAENGKISLNTCEIFGGTSLGILIVISRLIKKL
ncbi:Uncharacterised protein [Streptococcus pneumoniae]|nr:Uncharacterised protein [Streptococcus pneumoniae]